MNLRLSNRSYTFTDSDEIQSNSLDQKFEKLNQEMAELLKKYGFELAESCTSFHGVEKFSIENCQSCGRIMINRDKNPFGFGTDTHMHDIKEAIYNGGTIKDKNLCEECLPTTHRWGWNT